MIGRVSQFFLPTLTTLAVLIAGLVFLPNFLEANATGQYGSITVCKIIVDENGNIVDGSSKSGVTFDIAGISPAQNSGPAPAGQIGNSQFTTPLAFNASIIGSNDTECTTHSKLVLGSYYYGQETINPAVGWGTPKYNDQFTTSISSISDFFSYDGNLFDGNSGNDGARNKNADGHIVLDSQRPDRTLVVLNNLEAETPSTGGGSPSVGGASAPTCTSGDVQKVDQVWFSNVTNTQATVHWANLGDAHSYHIAYGPSQNNLPWGVEVVGNLNNFTIFDLLGGALWVQITANSSDDCGGPTSDPFTPDSGGQVLGINTLADTGTVNNLLVILAGFSMIGAGLWVFRKYIQR